eukprot:3328929-Rhodomonas_salina.1
MERSTGLGGGGVMQVGGRRQDRILRGWERVLRGPWIFCIWRWVMRAVNKRASGRVQKEESRDAGRSFATEATRAEVRRLQKQNHVFCFSRAAAGTGSAAVSPRRILDLVPVQFALEHHRLPPTACVSVRLNLARAAAEGSSSAAPRDQAHWHRRRLTTGQQRQGGRQGGRTGSGTRIWYSGW